MFVTSFETIYENQIPNAPANPQLLHNAPALLQITYSTIGAIIQNTQSFFFFYIKICKQAEIEEIQERDPSL